MDDGGGTIGGGSVYVKFHVGPKHNPTSEVELNDKTKPETKTLTFAFPDTVDMKTQVNGRVITVTTDQLKRAPIEIKWGQAAGQTLGASA